VGSIIARSVAACAGAGTAWAAYDQVANEGHVRDSFVEGWLPPNFLVVASVAACVVGVIALLLGWVLRRRKATGALWLAVGFVGAAGYCTFAAAFVWDVVQVLLPDPGVAASTGFQPVFLVLTALLVLGTFILIRDIDALARSRAEEPNPAEA